MSVYTCINQQQLEQFLGLYAIGGLVDFQESKPAWKIPIMRLILPEANSF